MSQNLIYMTTAEEYVSKLEDVANKDLFDPRQFSFDAILQYLDKLIQTSKECAQSRKVEDAYIGFRRFQIVLNSLQKHNLYNPGDSRIQQLNSKCMKISTILDFIRKQIEEKVLRANACLSSQTTYTPTSSASVLCATRLKNSNSVDSVSTRNSYQSQGHASYSETSDQLSIIRDSSLPTPSVQSPSLSSTGCFQQADPSLLSAVQSNPAEILNYVYSNLNLIPDVRDVKMHMGLPLPEDELDLLLKFDEDSEDSEDSICL